MRELSLSLTFSTFATLAHADGLVAERFSPAVTGGGYITAERPDTLGHLRFQIGLLSSYAHSPLRQVAGTSTTPVIDGSLGATLTTSLGLSRLLEVGVSLPAVLYQHGPGVGSAAALGDLQLHLKVRALHLRHFGLGAMGSLAVPTATGGARGYAGLSSVAFLPRLLLEGRGRYVRGALNAGLLLRPEAQAGDMTLSHELTYALALGVRPHARVELLGEVRGGTALLAPFQTQERSPAEAGGAVALLLERQGLVLSAGGSAGIVNGYGAPTWRVLAGLRYERPAPPARPVLEAKATSHRAERPPIAQAPRPPLPPPAAEPERAETAEAAAAPMAAVAVTVTAAQVIPDQAIFFDVNHARVRGQFAAALDAVAQTLIARPELGVIHIAGHTDSTGTPQWNRLLSRLRAQMVRAALIQRGVPEDRLVVVGLGARAPIADNQQVQGRARNRRVVFYRQGDKDTAKRPTPPRL